MVSVQTRIRIVAVFAAVAFALGIVAGARALTNDDDNIHIDDAPAYACLGEGCPP